MELAINPFVRRQWERGDWSLVECSEETIRARVITNFKKARHGYRDGVLEVPISPESVKCRYTLAMTAGKYSVEYRVRHGDEEPRFTPPRLWSPKEVETPASHCTVILYSSQLLATEGKNVLDPLPDNWEIISINASLVEDEPMHYMTLMANHFQVSGGTATNMSPEQFEKELRRSYMFWRDKAFCC